MSGTYPVEFREGDIDTLDKLNILAQKTYASIVGTSPTTNTISVGSKSFTTDTYLQFGSGSRVTIANSSDPSNKYLSGTVSSYSPATGVLVVDCTTAVGSGSYSAWTITLSGTAGPAGAPNTLSIGTIDTGTAGATITGTSPNQVLNLTLPPGSPGPANNLTIGTVSTGTADATITGTSPNQVLNLTIPAPVPNVLSIGTVTQGTAGASITGTAPNQTLNLTLPKGDTGNTGPAGPANTLSIGTVNTGSAAASITGTAPNQTLNLTLPQGVQGTKGDTGDTGPANTLSIGTVNTGSASASITGTAPNQTLNLTLPAGPANTLSIGTVNTGAANATITGTAPNQTLNLTLPQGIQGDAGPANTLSIGTVNTGTAAASVTGTAPNQTLNLTLPTAPANTLSIGTVNVGTADATITGTAPNQTLNLTIPQGPAGLIPRGAWNSATNYLAPTDLVTYGGSTYRRIVTGTTGTAPNLDATNWELFAAKGNDGAGSVVSVGATAPVVSSGGTNPNISIPVATGSVDGYLSSADFSTFSGKESPSNKDASGGYAGLTLFKINLKNAAGSVVSFLASVATTARTYTFPDKDGTVAMTSDITGTNSGTNTGDETTATIKSKLGITTLSGSNTGDQTLGSLGAEGTANKDASGGYAGLTLFKINLKNAAGTIVSFLTTTATAARTYTFPDKDGTVAMTSDITGTNSGTNTGDETTATIKSKLGITTLSGSNTGDQTLGSLGAEGTANKEVSGGYVGLTLLKINFKNVANTFTSFFTNSNTAARTYTFPDKDGTVAMTSDITGTNSGINTGDETTATIKSKLGITTLSGSNTGDQTLGSLGGEGTVNKDASGGYVGLTLFKINFKNVANTFTSFFTNSNTASRTYTFPDKDMTVADNADLAAKAPSANPTFTGTVTFPSQAQATFFAAPTGAAGVPSFRTISASDIPTLNQNTTGTASNVTGTVLGGNGGTGANNFGKIITVGGNFTTSGNYNLTLTLTGTTTLTLPTSGTLVSTGANTFTARQSIPSTVVPLVDKGTVASGTVTFDVSASEVQRLQVGGALTLAASNWATSGNRSYLCIKLVNGGSATITITPTINWIKPDGTTTTSISTYLTAIGRTALQTSGTDHIIWWTDDSGTVIFGKII